MLMCMVWAFLTLGFFTPAHDVPGKNAAQGAAQLACLGVILLRILYARWRGETSHAWILWTAVLVLAAPIWLVVYDPLWHAAQSIYNGLTRTSP